MSVMDVEFSLPFKGTVNKISSDPPCKDGNARFTSVSLYTALSD